jgi:hypothetical protein
VQLFYQGARLPKWVKRRNAHCEQMFSALHPKSRHDATHSACLKSANKRPCLGIMPSPIPIHRLSGIPDSESQEYVAGQTAPLRIA